MPSRRPPKTSPETFKFTTKLVRVGTLYGVDVPAAVSSAIGVRGYVPIAATINGAIPFHASLVPRGGGRHRILLNAGLRARAALTLGRPLRIELSIDVDPPQWATPEDLADALRDEGVLETFQSLARGKRNHIVQWLEQAARDTTRAKRVTQIVSVALGEREKKLDRESRGSAKRR